jgi:hypothetical protein
MNQIAHPAQNPVNWPTKRLIFLSGELKAESPYSTALISRQKLWINQEGFWTSPPKASFILFYKMNSDLRESPTLLVLAIAWTGRGGQACARLSRGE